MGLAWIAVQRTNTTLAREQYDFLRGEKGSYFSPVVMDRLLGLLAHTMGQPDTAAKHFEEALAFCRKAGYRPELAWTCHDYADMLLDKTIVGARSRAPLQAPRQKASALIDEGLAIATELGMKPLVGRLEGLRERLASLRRGRPEYPGGLSEREVEVLRLIAAGKSNQQIAETLVISLHTVERHVSNIFDKTGVNNRVEAASYAIRHGLT